MSELFQVLKKNAWWYTGSMLITGVTAFAAIVITKNYLSAELFIRFNLKLTAILMVNSVTSSWISLSIFRMLHRTSSFYSSSLIKLALINALFFAVPVYLCWLFWVKPGGSLLLPLVFLVIAALHICQLTLNQAALNARTTAFAEIIRGLTTLFLMFVPVLFKFEVSESFYWHVWIFAYVLSLLYLIFIGRRRMPAVQLKAANAQQGGKLRLRQMARFGLPFTLWTLVSYFLVYGDRWYLGAVNMDRIMTADYLALSDSIFRGVGFLFVPLNTSGFPVISRLYDSGDKRETYHVILRLIKIEIALLFGALILLVALHLPVFKLLKISTGTNVENIVLLSALLLTHGLWQVCAIIQKPLEMSMKILRLAYANLVSATVAYLLFYWIVRPAQPLYIVLCLFAGVLIYTTYVCTRLVKFGREVKPK